MVLVLSWNMQPGLRKLLVSGGMQCSGEHWSVDAWITVTRHEASCGVMVVQSVGGVIRSGAISRSVMEYGSRQICLPVESEK